MIIYFFIKKLPYGFMILVYIDRKIDIEKSKKKKRDVKQIIKLIN